MIPRVTILNVLHEHDDKRVFQKIARSLTAAGYGVVSIVPSREPVAEREGVTFRIIAPASSLPNRFLSVFRLVRVGLEVSGEEIGSQAQDGESTRDQVFFAVEPESWVAALILKFLRGGKVVFDMHEHVPTEFSKFFPRPLRLFMTWLTRKFMHLFARYTDLIILTRDSFEQDWTGVKTARVTIINTNHLQPKCAEIPEHLRHYQATPTIIHQGVFGDVRGSWQLLEAMKLLVREEPTLRCIVLGDYVYGSQDEYIRGIAEAGLTSNLIMPGRVSYEEVPAYIAVSRAGLILFQPGPMNHLLAMPHKLFDYMREGVPVVAPEFSLEVRHIVKESDCGMLVDVTSPQHIAEAILMLVRNPDVAAELGANGRRAVEERYNWQREEQVLLEAIARL